MSFHFKNKKKIENSNKKFIEIYKKDNIIRYEIFSKQNNLKSKYNISNQ